MLKAAEIEIKKEHQVLMVNKTTSFKKQGKSKGKFKKGGKAAMPPVKPKNGPKPDAECYYCKEKGHWKHNCSKYLADLKSGLVKKKKEADEDIPTSLLPPSLANEDEPAVKLKSNEVRIGPITRARAKLLKQQVSRGDMHRTRRGALDVKTDIKKAVKLDMELDMKISHGRARGGAGGMRERRRRSPGRSDPVDRH
ncbi:hypothetical protein QYE76_057084 [Lolium multiflorum]|uniref:CCHC-type domain-containing protein n=1 Tax=Lolium multiflorum TaxID=4521 RepID=A0AAD8T4D8_LOLMU|nr:hypothetical protein QYE76_057084 [Lolium multiflorum]